MHRRTVIGAIAGASLPAVTGGYVHGPDATLPTAVDDRAPGDSGRLAASDNHTAAAAPAPAVTFELTPYELIECGTTCREATTTLTNTGDTAATDVRVTVLVSTADTHVWGTDHDIGRLSAGAAVTQTHRVEVDFGTVLAIRANDGQLTVETTITSAQRTARIVREVTVETDP